MEDNIKIFFQVILRTNEESQLLNAMNFSSTISEENWSISSISINQINLCPSFLQQPYFDPFHFHFSKRNPLYQILIFRANSNFTLSTIVYYFTVEASISNPSSKITDLNRAASDGAASITF